MEKTLNKISDAVSEYLADIIGVVEATSFEQLCLWERYHEKYEWESTRHGYLPAIGSIDSRPIHVSLMTVTVKGHKILFWEATSVVVDHDMIKEWFTKYLPKSAFQSNSEYINSTDAQNFHNIFHYVDYAKVYEKN